MHGHRGIFGICQLQLMQQRVLEKIPPRQHWHASRLVNDQQVVVAIDFIEMEGNVRFLPGGTMVRQLLDRQQEADLPRRVARFSRILAMLNAMLPLSPARVTIPLCVKVQNGSSRILRGECDRDKSTPGSYGSHGRILKPDA